MNHHYTEPSRLARLGYRYVYDPMRARYLRETVAWLGLAGSERVLDFGSGAGSEAKYLAAALGYGGRLTCFDVSGTWLGEARCRLRGFSNVDFYEGDASRGELPRGPFDVIFAQYVLHDVDRTALPLTLASLARVLRAGGRFVAVEPVSSAHIHALFSAEELRAAMAAVGLTETYRDEVPFLPGRARRSVFVKPA